MPRKTRKEKIQSQQRVEIHAAQPLVFSYTAHSSASAHRAITSTIDDAYIKKDIVKTVVLGSIFIALEFALYFYSGRLGW